MLSTLHSLIRKTLGRADLVAEPPACAAPICAPMPLVWQQLAKDYRAPEAAVQVVWEKMQRSFDAWVDDGDDANCPDAGALLQAATEELTAAGSPPFIDWKVIRYKASLTPEQRRLYDLHLKGFTVAEIAEGANLSVDQVMRICSGVMVNGRMKCMAVQQ